MNKGNLVPKAFYVTLSGKKRQWERGSSRKVATLSGSNKKSTFGLQEFYPWILHLLLKL